MRKPRQHRHTNIASDLDIQSTAAADLQRLIDRDLLAVSLDATEEEYKAASPQSRSGIPIGLAELMVRYLSNELGMIET